MVDILPAANPEAQLLERRQAAIATLKAAGFEPKHGYFGGIEIHVKDAEQVAAALLAAQEASRLRDAIARMVPLSDSVNHFFEHYHDGDGWREPYSDTYVCYCGHVIADWTQTNPDLTGRRDPADMLLAWRAHVVPVYDRCWCTGRIGPRPAGDADGLGCLADPAHDYQKPPADTAKEALRA